MLLQPQRLNFNFPDQELVLWRLTSIHEFMRQSDAFACACRDSTSKSGLVRRVTHPWLDASLLSDLNFDPIGYSLCSFFSFQSNPLIETDPSGYYSAFTSRMRTPFHPSIHVTQLSFGRGRLSLSSSLRRWNLLFFLLPSVSRSVGLQRWDF